LALEYGITLADVAKKHKVKVTPELVERMEEILIREMSTKTAEQVALDFVPNLLAAFETKLE